MNSSVEPLEGNKVKVLVEVSEAEFDADLDRAFKVLAREVRLPGFRPGKAPRKVLEKRIGSGYAREQAFQDGLPTYYALAVKEHEVDVIAPPTIDITDGRDEGPVHFEAVVEVRPSVEVSGYEGLSVTIPNPIVSDEEIAERIDSMRAQNGGELADADRSANEGDRVVIDITCRHEGEEVAGLTADGYTYELGLGAVVPELDEQLAGASAGDELEFTAVHPDPDEAEPLEFEITVVKVQEMILPEANDDWAKEQDFDSMDALTEDLRERMGRARRYQSQAASRQGVADALGELVSDDDLPEAMVDMEADNRAQDLVMRLQAQGMEFGQYLQMTGQSQEMVLAELRHTAVGSAKLDLALRSIVASQSLDVDDTELDAEFERVADRLERSAAEVRDELVEAGQLPAVRADLAKSKALDWVTERVTFVDEDGATIDPSLLEDPEEDDDPVAVADESDTDGDNLPESESSETDTEQDA